MATTGTTATKTAAAATVKPMGKTELVESIATSTKIERAKVRQVVEAFVETVTKELKRKGRVQITGFGTFSISKRAKRTGVNPKTGDKIQIAARNVPRFTPGKSLKDTVA
jgi:DNA-binding protein HU-beta